MEELLAEAGALGLPPWPREERPSSGHLDVQLYVLVRLFAPKLMVETGVETGRSSFAILSAMKRNGTGHLYSIDPGPQPFPWDHGWCHYHLTSQEALPRLGREFGPIQPDLFLHDSDHSYECQTFEYDWAWEHVGAGGLILSDDYTWAGHGAWADFCGRHPEHPHFVLDRLAVLVR